MPSRILIVDPEELPRMELAIQLQESGYKVEVAENGREALEILAESHPDLVITELLLGQLSGFELSARIAAEPDHACPVLFYTGFYRSESARQEIIKKYFAAGYFIKPFQLPQLKKAVAGIIRLEEEMHSVVTHQEETVPLEEPTLPLTQPLHELEEEPSALKMPPPLVASTAESKERISQANQESLQLPEPVKGESIIALPVQVPQVEPIIEQVGVEAVLEKLASEEVPDAHVRRPNPSGAPLLSTVRSPKQPLSGLDDESLPSFLSSAAQPARRGRSLPLFLLMVLVLIGLSIVYYYRHEFSLARLFRPRQSSTQQAASLSELKSAGGSAQPDNRVVLERKMEKSAEPPPTPEEVQPASPPVAQGLTPQESEPVTPDRQTSPIETQQHNRAEHRQPSVLLVKVNEISGQVGPPHLRRAPRMEIPANSAKTITKPLVVRLEVSPTGKVIGLKIINESHENAALVPIVQSTLPDWEFTSTGAASGNVLVKYFSAKIMPAEDRVAPSR